MTEAAARPKRLLITGSRDWTDEEMLHAALRQAWYDLGADRSTILVSGNCRTGADKMAEDFWEKGGLPVERHPAEWDKYSPRAKAGPIRNQHMVDLGADLCVAFMNPGSVGTKHCSDAATLAGIPVRIYRPDGSVEYRDTLFA